MYFQPLKTQHSCSNKNLPSHFHVVMQLLAPGTLTGRFTFVKNHCTHKNFFFRSWDAGFFMHQGGSPLWQFVKTLHLRFLKIFRESKLGAFHFVYWC